MDVGVGCSGHGGLVSLTGGDALNDEQSFNGGDVHISAGRSDATGGSVELVTGWGGLASGGIMLATSNASQIGSSGSIGLTTGSAKDTSG